MEKPVDAASEISGLKLFLENDRFERDSFLRSLIRELAGTLEEIVGLEEASGYISVVGQHIGDIINKSYKDGLGTARLSLEQVEQVLVDLKARIQGDFYLIEHDEDKIVLGNRLCPFADKVIGHPSMCMMTSNVFGSITADNLGYAKVVLQKTIAGGDEGCLVTVYLKPGPEADNAEGREYFPSGDI